MTLFLNCQSLSKSFGNRTLFEDLSFSIFSGDRVGLIGPNGAGKSDTAQNSCRHRKREFRDDLYKAGT